MMSACSKTDQLSEREIDLLSQDYHLRPLPMDSLQSYQDLIFYLDSVYCIQVEQRWPTINFDLKSKEITASPNRHSITIGIDPSPCISGEFESTMILEIIKDGYNTTIENEKTEIDSIPNFVKKQMLSKGEDPNYMPGIYGNGIWICTSKADKTENLNPYIYKTIMGFVAAANQYSIQTYGKKLDEIRQEQFDIIKEEFIFHLSFKYTDKEPEIKLDI